MNNDDKLIQNNNSENQFNVELREISIIDISGEIVDHIENHKIIKNTCEEVKQISLEQPARNPTRFSRGMKAVTRLSRRVFYLRCLTKTYVYDIIYML